MAREQVTGYAVRAHLALVRVKGNSQLLVLALYCQSICLQVYLQHMSCLPCARCDIGGNAVDNSRNTKGAYTQDTFRVSYRPCPATVWEM